MIIRTTVGDNFIEKVQNIFNDQSCCVKINVDVKHDCMTYIFQIIFIQEHVKNYLGRGTNEMRKNTIATMMGDKGQ